MAISIVFFHLSIDDLISRVKKGKLSWVDGRITKTDLEFGDLVEKDPLPGYTFRFNLTLGLICSFMFQIVIGLISGNPWYYFPLVLLVVTPCATFIFDLFLPYGEWVNKVASKKLTSNPDS
ncbi:hypothetical protein H6775_00040 [Candidatus Nomurabacteria bacterium]|nr:hypothetical protein [Candidatus Nomurabacteria bacterium]